MKCQLLGGVAAAALVLATASSAWANPKNSFSNENAITVTSTATAATGAGGAGGAGGAVDGTGGAGGGGGGSATATSESYNVSSEGVSNQSLVGTVTDNSISALWDYEDSTTGDANFGGAASIGGFDNAAGVSVASANTGSQSLNQQAVSLGVVGTVNFNQNSQ
jgi:hypothetical protein